LIIFIYFILPAVSTTSKHNHDCVVDVVVAILS